MRTTKNLIAAIAGGLGGLALVTLAPTPASGQAPPEQECNGFIDLAYVNPPFPTIIGDTVRVKITIGAGEIVAPPPNPIQPPRISFGPTINGTQLDALHFFLDCQLNIGMVTPDACLADGVISYPGDANANIDTTCHEDPNNPASPKVTWKSTVLSVNELAFNPVLLPQGVVSLAAPLVPPAVQGPCDLLFDVTVTGIPHKGLCSQSGFPPGIQCNPQGPNTCPGAPNEVCFGFTAEIAEYPVAVCSNALTSGGFQTAAIGVLPEEQPPFNCYQTKKGSLKSKKTVDIADVFGNGSLTLSVLHRFCAPTNKNDEHPEFITLPGHLAGYEFSNVAGTFQKPNGVTVNTQFGTYTVNVRNPKRLLVPSAKSKLGPPPASPLPPGTPPRHFLCHDVDNVRGPKLTGVSAEDQFFALTVNSASLGASTLCAPANKNDEDPPALTDPNFLLCIDSKTSTPFPDTNLFFNNQFGPSDQQFNNPNPFFESYDELCLPATIQIP